MWALLSAAWAGCLVLSGGEVFDGKGFVKGDLVAVDGRIAAVGTGIAGLAGDTYQGRACDHEKLPAGALVTPGFVDAWASIGVHEIGLEPATVDDGGTPTDPIRASLRVTDAYNPSSAYVPVWRAAGITSAVIVPGGGRVSGQSGWVRLAGQTQSDAVIEPSVAVHADLGGESKAEALQTLRELLQDARAYAANKTAVDQNRFRSFVEGASRHDLEALGPVVKGEIPLVVMVDRASDIEAVLRLAADEKVKLVISGGAEAWRHAEALATAGVPVVLSPTTYGPGSFDQIEARPDNAALLEKAGVTVLVHNDANYNAPALRFIAGNAVRGGMSKAGAIRALTEGPAKAFGLDDHGTLAVGQVADVVAWSGDPLEIGTRVLLVAIDGERQSLDNRHQALFRRYRTLPGSPTPALDVAPLGK
ncbi:MAG: amidohydrolase family protein [Alphaproteobacteria bacterium]|nr:amidohydrolase family protein [Alphaproteobacteria bacterium]